MNGSTDRYADIKNRICELAGSDDSILAVAVIGSSTRKDTPADEYSDLDLIIVTDEPERWYSGEYPEMLGEVSISFIEPTLGGGRERRCIYSGARDVDMLIFTHGQFVEALEKGVAGWVMNRGYRFLYDSRGYEALAEKHVDMTVKRPSMTEEEFQNITGDFYFHNIWAYKKLLRGELWSAKMCIDAYLKVRLLTMIEQYQLSAGNTDVWHDGRFLDRWADTSVLGELEHCFAHYSTDDCKQALYATHRLFARLASAVARKRSFSYPAGAEKCAAEFIGISAPEEVFESGFARCEYIGKDNAVLHVWKKEAHFSDYRLPVTASLDMLRKHKGSIFIVDARNGFEDVREDVDWGFEYFLPELKKTGCEVWGFILPEVSNIEGEIDLWTREIEKNFFVIRAESYEQILRAAAERFGCLEYTGSADATLYYTYKGCRYRLASQPYEPCLYIIDGERIVCTLHNAFNTSELIGAFSEGKTVRAIDGRIYDERTFCRLLASAVDSGRSDMDVTFAARQAGI